jgi:hypothetical protein
MIGMIALAPFFVPFFAVICIINNVFLCAPFKAAGRQFRKTRITRSQSRQFPRKATHIRTFPDLERVAFKYSTQSTRHRCRCRLCDRDFQPGDNRRQWLRLTPAKPRLNKSWTRARPVYVFTPRYTRDVLRDQFGRWKRQGGVWSSWERGLTILKYEMRATEEARKEMEARKEKRAAEEGATENRDAAAAKTETKRDENEQREQFTEQNHD